MRRATRSSTCCLTASVSTSFERHASPRETPMARAARSRRPSPRFLRSAVPFPTPRPGASLRGRRGSSRHRVGRGHGPLDHFWQTGPLMWGAAATSKGRGPVRPPFSGRERILVTSRITANGYRRGRAKARAEPTGRDTRAVRMTRFWQSDQTCWPSSRWWPRSPNGPARRAARWCHCDVSWAWSATTTSAEASDISSTRRTSRSRAGRSSASPRRSRRRWPGVRLALHHRVGRLEIGEASVAIAAASAHRADAFARAGTRSSG